MSNIDTLILDLVYFPLILSRNKLTHTIQEADPATYPNRNEIEYFLEISKPEFLGSNNYVAYPRLRRKEKMPYNKVGITIYEGATFSQIQNLLDSSLTRKKPNHQQDVMSVAWGMTSNFKLREIVEPNIRDISLPTAQIIKSGISELDYKLYGDSFYSKVWAGKFLTFQPNNKIIGKASEEYLYFLLNFTPLPSQLRLRVNCWKKDGTTQVITALTSKNIKNIPINQVICIPVGFSQLNLSTDTVKYSIWVSNENNERLSEERTYLVDSFYQHQERNLLISNSLGAFDTVRLLGESMRQLKVSRNIIEVDAENTAELAELRVISVKGNRSLTISTGNIKKNTIDTLKYLNELMLAEEIFEVTDKGHIPMILDTTEYIDCKDNPELTSLRLTFRYTLTERNFSDLPKLAPQPTRPTAWRNYGDFTCELDEFYKRTGNSVYTRIELYYLDTNEAVRPRQIKLNLSDDPDYVQPTPSVDCSMPRFLSDEQMMESEYKKSDCVQPYLGTYPTILIPAERWGSENSKEEANQRAMAEMYQRNTQLYADNFGSCEFGLYLNTLINREGSYVRQGCPNGLVGTKAEIVVDSGSFSSNISQEAAQAMAEARFAELDTQAYANEFGSCEIFTFDSAEIVRLGTFNRANCASGYVGGPATITIAAGMFTSTISQEDADSQAEMSYLSKNTQKHANANGTCTLAAAGIFGRFFDHPLSNTRDESIFSGTPVYERTDLRIDHGNNNSIQFPEIGNGWDYYGIHFTGFLKAPVTGTVTIWVDINEASEWFTLAVGDNNLEKTTGTQTTLSIVINANQNEYLPLDLKYIEFAGGDGIRLSWSYAGQAKVTIPDAAYSHSTL